MKKQDIIPLIAIFWSKILRIKKVDDPPKKEKI